MPVRILRWKGGCGGDMILHGVNSVEKVVNVSFNDILPTGQTGVDLSDVDFDHLTEIQKIALKPDFHRNINEKKLADEIARYQSQPDLHWIKSHYYGNSDFNSLTVDIKVDAHSLPFVVSASWNKTHVSSHDFNRLVPKINSHDLRQKYTFYSVAKDALEQSNLSNQNISVSDIIGGREKFYAALSTVDIDMRHDYIDRYDRWLKLNASHIPSRTYVSQVINKDYTLDNPNLSLVEKYCLLVLSKQKFCVLD